MDTGKFPDPETLDEGQAEFVKQREKGHFNPIVGGVPETPPPIDPNQKLRNDNTTPQQRGRPMGAITDNRSAASKTLVSIDSIKDTVYAIEDFRRELVEQLEEKHGCEQLSEGQEDVVNQICESIVCAKEKEEWSNTAKECVKDSRNISKLNIALAGVVDLVSEYGLDDYAAAILYHSQNEE
jgi:hypothetical protein